ncbi:MAG TPA: hypothetical protein VHW64_15090 [Nocardioides sp.]|uniref:YVTN family beta-propeller repeat protein n=1 Tax=Nocardioides sp. TaxID=35761 RepID=UPI002E3268F6|nr:hypothetical protein [Nocardioides sp.]HEX3932027.1 hypothetical protein [Nocardioides sp.]
MSSARRTFRRPAAAPLAIAGILTGLLWLPAPSAQALGAGTYAYVTNSATGQDSVFVVDTATGSTVANVPVASYPSAVAVSADGLKAYVAEDSGVQVIDATQEAVVDTIALPGNGSISEAVDVALSPDGTRLYVVDLGQGELFVLDTATDQVTATITVGSDPTSVVATSTQVYVANSGDDTVSVVDPASNTVTSTFDAGGEPTGLALVPAAGRLYVADNVGDVVSVFDTSTNSLITTVAAPGAYQLAVSPDGGRVYASVDNGILVLDSASSTVLTTIDTGTARFADVTVGPDGRIYDADGTNNTGSLDVFDPVTFQQVSTTTLSGILNSVTIGTIAPPPPPAKKADVQVRISGPSRGSARTTYAYTETVRNAGPGRASRVLASLALPRGATLVSASGAFTRYRDLVIWRSVPSLAAGASRTYSAKVRLSSRGTESLLAVAGSLNTPDPNLRNNLAVVSTRIS